MASITHTTVAAGTDAGNGEIHKAQWNEAHTITGAIRRVPRCFANPNPVVASSVNFTFGGTAPNSTYPLFALTAQVANATTISSISQTNVTWTQMHTVVNGTGSRCDLWKGVPSGTPATTGTVTAGGSTNLSVSLWQWPYSLSLTGTYADNTGSGTNQTSGTIQPADGSMVVVVHCCNNGTINLQPERIGPPCDTQLAAAVSTFAWMGVTEGISGADFYSGISQQTSSVWANFVAYIV